MPIKLPGTEQISQPESGRSGRSIASIDLSAVGEGIARMGAGFEDVGSNIFDLSEVQRQRGIYDQRLANDALEKADKERLRQENFDANDLYLKSTQKWDEEYNKRVLAMPVGGKGFTESLIKDLDADFGPIVKNTPESQQAAAAEGYYKLKNEYRAKAQKAELDEKIRYGTATLEEAETTILNGVQTNPDNWQDADAQAKKMRESLVDANPTSNAIRETAWKKRHAQAIAIARKDRDGAAAAAEGLTPEAGSFVISSKRGYTPDISNTNPALLRRFNAVQTQFGRKIPIVSGTRSEAKNKAAGGAKHSQHLGGNAIDLDVSNLSPQERVQLIQTASANGITGIGVYENSMHFDIGNRRAWGPTHHYESVPGWAKGAIAAHLQGTSQPLARGGGYLGEGVTASPAHTLIRNKEGFRTQAYRDNGGAFRVGYGSDTWTDAAGRSHVVGPNTVITQADAERDLARRVAVFEGDARKKVGAEAWDRLDPATKAALTSLAYNYGELPDRVIGAIRSGDKEAMSQAVARLGMDNGGINRTRRAEEAAIIAGRAQVPGETGGYSLGGGEVAPEYAALSFEDRVNLRNKLLADQAAQDKENEIKVKDYLKKQKDELKNNLLIGAHDGDVSEPDANKLLHDGVIDFSEYETVTAAIKKYQGDVAAIQSFQERLARGYSTFNTGKTSDDRKSLNTLWDKSVEQGKLSEGDPDAFTSLTSTFKDTAMMPDTAMGEIAGMLRSKDSAKVGTALSYLDGLEQANNAAFRAEMDQDMEAKLAMFQNRRDYYSAEEVGEQIIRSEDIDKRKEREASMEAIKPKVDKLTFEDLVPTLDPSWPGYLGRYFGFGMQPAFQSTPQAVLLDDYKMLVTQQYALTGDLESAKAQAGTRLMKVWNISEANGNRLTKFFPEGYYPQVTTADPHGYMKDQIRSALDEAGLSHKEGGGPPPGKYEAQIIGPRDVRTVYPEHGLVPDSVTRAELASGKPLSYQFWYIDEMGLPGRVMRPGPHPDFSLVPQRIRFDPETAKAENFVKETKRQQDENIRRRAMEERIKEGSADPYGPEDVYGPELPGPAMPSLVPD